VERLLLAVEVTLSGITTDIAWLKKIGQGIILGGLAGVGALVFDVIKTWLAKGGLPIN